MPKTKAQKEELVAKLHEKIDNAKSMIFVNFAGTTVSEIQKFRSDCYDGGAEYVVSKKTLLRKALHDKGFDAIDPTTFENEVGLVLSYDDVVSGPKVTKEFAKAHETIQFVGGVIANEGEFLSKDRVKQLADIPSRDELYAKMVGSMNAPISNFVGVLHGNLRGLVTVLSAIKDQKA